ncbi:unnamed protein product [Durusdinium trenchii]|uniref:Tyrosine-protein phosphatase domain-containing protein n=1 Tax=Durusdinium trenchii TaxID=1381693 RepID=A0ABP0LLB8_9DINO
MSGDGLGYEILGAVKVKDGLFVGDALAAQDLEFVVSNKVTRVINCAGRQVPNHWESIGVAYLTYYWVDADSQVVLDTRDVVSSESFRFIEEALNSAESVLIHSVRGQSRSCCILGAYMMKKYSWGLRKTMEFISFRRPDMNLKSAFMQQLSALERRLVEKSKQSLSVDWTDASNSWEAEDLLLRNTYLNGQMGPLAEFHSGALERHIPRRLCWLDQESHDKSRLEKPAGADRHNVLTQASELQGILKRKTRAAPRLGGTGPAQRMSQARDFWKKDEEQPMLETANGGYPKTAEVPTAWADEGEAHFRPHPMGSSSGFEASRGSPMPATRDVRDRDLRDRDPRAPESREIRKGPTNLRDSLTMGRRSESPVPEERRASSNDPPPRGSSRRNESPQQRDVGRGRYPTVTSSSPQSFGINFGVRTPTPGVGSQRAMGAFRGGGPVRAKPDLLDNRPPGRTRPSTAPSTPTRSGSSRRPASPSAQIRSGSSSRPPSPNSRSQSGPPTSTPTRYVPGHSYPGSSPLDRSARSMSSHLRRAPSPTPSFNAPRTSSAKPRWRS